MRALASLVISSAALAAACGDLTYDPGPGYSLSAIEEGSTPEPADATAPVDASPDAIGSPDGGGAPVDAPFDAARETATDAPDDGAKNDASEGGGAHDAAPEAGGLGYACSGASPSFANDVSPLFMSCSGELCHGGSITPDGGRSVPWPWSSLVDVPASRDTCKSAGDLVVPGDVGASYLVKKLTGLEMCPHTNRMPEYGTPLNATEMQTIVDWICQGAQND